MILHQKFYLQKEADLIIEHQKLSNTQSVIMQHAIANSVRLCVVAPTVTVHIADEIHRLQSGYVHTCNFIFLEIKILKASIKSYSKFLVQTEIVIIVCINSYWILISGYWKIQ